MNSSQNRITTVVYSANQLAGETRQETCFGVYNSPHLRIVLQKLKKQFGILLLCHCYRVRDLGLSLSNPDRVLSQQELEGQLLIVQASVRGVADDVDTALGYLRRDEHSSSDTSSFHGNNFECLNIAEYNQTGSEVKLVADSAHEEVEASGSECSSEEEVFEGYAEESTGNGCGKWEGPTHMSSDSEEVPMHVLKELKTVLTIRNHEREERRAFRHRHKERGHQHEDTAVLRTDATAPAGIREGSATAPRTREGNATAPARTRGTREGDATEIGGEFQEQAPGGEADIPLAPLVSSETSCHILTEEEHHMSNSDHVTMSELAAAIKGRVKLTEEKFYS